MADGYELTADLIERILRAVVRVEAGDFWIEQQEEPDPAYPVPFRWFQLNENLDAGGNADAYPVNWDPAGDGGNGEYAADSEADLVNVVDFSGQHCGLQYDWVLCRLMFGDLGAVWEVIQGGPIHRKVVLQEVLYPGSTANAHATIRENTVDVTVSDVWLGGDDSIDSDSTVGITYDVDSKSWDVDQAECG